jgi:hypothetical protein
MTAAQDTVAAALTTPVIPVASTELVVRAEAEFPRHHPDLDLNQAHRELVHQVATTEYLAVLGNTVPGTGRSAVLALLADVLDQAGGRVLGLAPGRIAANHLARDLGALAFPVDDWLQRQRQDAPTVLRPRSGDALVVCDPAVMRPEHLVAVLHSAETHGAVVLLLGDPAQPLLSAPAAPKDDAP